MNSIHSRKSGSSKDNNIPSTLSKIYSSYESFRSNPVMLKSLSRKRWYQTFILPYLPSTPFQKFLYSFTLLTIYILHFECYPFDYCTPLRWQEYWQEETNEAYNHVTCPCMVPHTLSSSSSISSSSASLSPDKKINKVCCRNPPCKTNEESINDYTAALLSTSSTRTYFTHAHRLCEWDDNFSSTRSDLPSSSSTSKIKEGIFLLTTNLDRKVIHLVKDYQACTEPDIYREVVVIIPSQTMLESAIDNLKIKYNYTQNSNSFYSYQVPLDVPPRAYNPQVLFPNDENHGLSVTCLQIEDPEIREAEQAQQWKHNGPLSSSISSSISSSLHPDQYITESKKLLRFAIISHDWPENDDSSTSSSSEKNTLTGGMLQTKWYGLSYDNVMAVSLRQFPKIIGIDVATWFLFHTQHLYDRAWFVEDDFGGQQHHSMCNFWHKYSNDPSDYVSTKTADSFYEYRIWVWWKYSRHFRFNDRTGSFSAMFRASTNLINAISCFRERHQRFIFLELLLPSTIKASGLTLRWYDEKDTVKVRCCGVITHEELMKGDNYIIHPWKEIEAACARREKILVAETEKSIITGTRSSIRSYE